MILELPPGSSPLLCGVAALALAAHITGGAVAIGSGGVALVAKKGSWLHRRAGNWFFGSMAVMALVGATVSCFMPTKSNIMGGLFAFYLVATSWLTVRRVPGQRFLEWSLFGVGLGTALLGLHFGWVGQHSPDGLIDNVPFPMPYLFALICLGAIGGDGVRMLRGAQGATGRIVRHLWRMCLALLMAASSFFIGQQQVMPVFLQGSPLLALPELFVLAPMLYWLTRSAWRAHRRLPLWASAPLK